MTSQTDVLRTVIATLDEVGLDYMLVGSFASSVHGERRDTHDIDIVIAMPEQSIADLHRLFGEEFYFDDESAREAVVSRDMFNVIHYDSGFKVDFWILKNDEFATTQFARRMPAEIWGVSSYVETPEDTVLSKLLWYKMGHSARQWSDIKGVLALQKDRLDWDYLKGWAGKVGVTDLLSQLTEEN
jgi:hypothetical protein